MNTATIVWIVLIGAAFAYLWWNGKLLELKRYVDETMDEMKRCNWPTWAELKGSTALVFVSIAVLGGFTMAVDYVFVMVVRWTT